MKRQKRLKLSTNQKEVPYINKAVAAMIAEGDKNLERESAERGAWFEKNEPRSVYGPRRYCSREYEWEHREELELQRFTLEYLKRQRLWHPRPNTTWQNYEVEAAAASVREGLSHLLTLGSKADGLAQRRLAEIAIDSTRFLEGLKTPSREARNFAMREVFWPTLQTPFRGLVVADSKDSLPVGENLLDGFKGLGQHWAALKEATRGGQGVARKWALELLLEVESARQQPNRGADNYFEPRIPEWRLKAIKLKRLTAEEKTTTDWIEGCRLLFKDKTGGEPERIPELAELAKNSGGKRTNLIGKPVAEKSNKRAAIWEAVKDSIKRFLGIHRAQIRKTVQS